MKVVLSILVLVSKVLYRRKIGKTFSFSPVLVVQELGDIYLHIL
jgi:hypothetical protein